MTNEEIEKVMNNISNVCDTTLIKLIFLIFEKGEKS